MPLKAHFLLLLLLSLQEPVFAAERAIKRSGQKFILDHTQTSATKDDEELFKSFWNEDTLEELAPENTFKNSDVVSVRAFIENKEKKELAGLVIFKGYDSGNSLYILYLCDKKTFQGEGIGSGIIKNLFDTYSPAKIEVGLGCHADDFYKKLGFYYSDETKEFMIKKIHSNS